MKHFYEAGSALPDVEQRQTFRIQRKLKTFLNSFQCWMLSLGTIYYQFSCYVQKSRARGTTDEGGRGKKQAGMRPSWSMVSVMSFNTLLIHCYYFTHTWRILRPYTKTASARVAGWFGVASRLGRTLVHNCSTGVRLLFECCSSAVRVRVEAQSKASRRAPEGLSNKCRRAPEGLSNKCRRALEGLSNNSRSRVEELANRPPRFTCKEGKMMNDLYMNRLILRWFQSFCEGVRGKVESMLIKSKRSSQNDLNEAGGFLLDKERADDIKRPMVYGLQLIAIFCVLFNFASATGAKAQELRQGGATEIGEIKPLEIGDTIPEEIWNMPLQVVNHPEGKETITLNDYRDKKLIILDFWATWCGACLVSFPRMHNLETEMAGKAKVLAITTQNDSIVRNFLEKSNSPHLAKLKSNFYSAVNGKYFRQLFKSASIPHVVVIDQRGVVRARTVPSVLSVTNLMDITENPFSAPIPMLIEQIKRPLLMSTFAERDRGMYYSGLYPFSHTLPYIQHTNIDSLKRIIHFFYTNAPVIQLFSAALKYAPNYVNGLATIPSRRIFEVTQPERFDNRLSDDNLPNWYAYESVNPFGTVDEVVRKRMLDDLQFYLGLDAVYEKREVKCLVLRIANLAEVPVNKEKVSASQLVINGRTRGDGTADGRFEQEVTQKQMPTNSYAYNFKLERLAYTLNKTMRLGIPYVIDETGFHDAVNLVLPDNLSNIEELQKTFLEQGMRLDYENRKLTMFVLKEKGYTPLGKHLVMRGFGYAYDNGEEGGE